MSICHYFLFQLNDFYYLIFRKFRWFECLKIWGNRLGEPFKCISFFVNWSFSFLFFFCFFFDLSFLWIFYLNLQSLLHFFHHQIRLLLKLFQKRYFALAIILLTFYRIILIHIYFTKSPTIKQRVVLFKLINKPWADSFIYLVVLFYLFSFCLWNFLAFFHFFFIFKQLFMQSLSLSF